MDLLDLLFFRWLNGRMRMGAARKLLQVVHTYKYSSHSESDRPIEKSNKTQYLQQFMSYFVRFSSTARYSRACSRLSPHISSQGFRSRQNRGRRSSLNNPQPLVLVRCIHRIPAGLPFGMPGIGEEIDGAIQQAPQFFRQSIVLNQTAKRMNVDKFTRHYSITVSRQND